MTILQQIADAMKAALNTGRPAGVPEARYWTGIAIEPQDLPYRTLAWTEETVERSGGVATSPLVVRRVRFSVQDVVAGTGAGGQTPQQVCEPYRAWSVKALVGNRYLDGDGKPTAIDTVEAGSSWDSEQGEVPFIRCTHSFDVTFTTRANDAELRV